MKKKIIKEYEDTLDLLLDDYEKDIKKITTATRVFLWASLIEDAKEIIEGDCKENLTEEQKQKLIDETADLVFDEKLKILKERLKK